MKNHNINSAIRSKKVSNGKQYYQTHHKLILNLVKSTKEKYKIFIYNIKNIINVFDISFKNEEDET